MSRDISPEYQKDQDYLSTRKDKGSTKWTSINLGGECDVNTEYKAIPYRLLLDTTRVPFA